MEQIEQNRDLATEPPTAEEKRLLSQARAFLGGVTPSPGLKISIMRVGPTWIPGGTGWLETVDYNEPTDFSLEQLKESHGGGAYVLKVLDQFGKFIASQSVKIAGEPKKNGKIITEQMVSALSNQIQSAPQNTGSDIGELLKILVSQMNAQQQHTLKLMSEALDRSQHISQAAPGQGSLKDIAEMVRFVDDIRGPAVTAPQEDSSGALTAMMGLLANFMSQKQEQKQPPKPQPVGLLPKKPPQPVFSQPKKMNSEQSQSISAPVVASVGPVERPKDIEMENNVLENNQDDEIDEEISLVDEISQLPPAELGQLVQELIPKLAEEQLMHLASVLQGFSKQG